MKLPWVLKYGFRQLLGSFKGSALIAWLEGPAGAAINAVSGDQVQQLLDSADRAVVSEASKLASKVGLP
ncbi:hypothetical protein UFOVP349_52 [uncultured Caudovirales phage]|uniref:Uncharacterized protein n=1 Tax=uncultured Caudovirales phage TaxID=2100421 RepID=A0A6J5M208_9CAUD|nr:hypothetical protein UFOVP349_52 [uncultured Caudovirales phage]